MKEKIEWILVLFSKQSFFLNINYKKIFSTLMEKELVWES
jgi:hypothetical protein